MSSLEPSNSLSSSFWCLAWSSGAWPGPRVPVLESVGADARSVGVSGADGGSARVADVPVKTGPIASGTGIDDAPEGAASVFSFVLTICRPGRGALVQKTVVSVVLVALDREPSKALCLIELDMDTLVT